MKAEHKDFIGVYDDVVSKEYCQRLINHFERVYEMGKTDSRRKKTNSPSTSQDNSIYFMENERDQMLMDDNALIMGGFMKALSQAYPLYKDEYPVLDTLARHRLNSDVKIQRTKPGEGYHQWHCERDGVRTSRRLILVLLYLNDIEEGGETEFLYQHRRIKPVAGRMVISPTAYTHFHRGNPPLDKAKYMINGWIEFIE